MPGAVVLAHILKTLEADSITISDFGVREGLVIDYLASHGREIHALGDIEDLRFRSVLQMLQKFQPEDRHLRHARHVARLSLVLFDALRKRHGLDHEARDLLHFAALLHDVGAVVDYDRHAVHSSYLIRNGKLRGLSAEEVGMIALVAHYHGKARPRKRDDTLDSLDKRRRRTVRWLSAMLRIAEGLDRSHYQLVQDLEVASGRGRVSLRLTVRRGAGLEQWAARRRTDLLARLLGARVAITIKRSTDAPGAARRRRPAGTAKPAAAKMRIPRLAPPAPARGTERRRKALVSRTSA